MTVRHLLRHAAAVRARIRSDPGIADFARAALPLIAAGQTGAVLGHLGLSAARNVRRSAFTRP